MSAKPSERRNYKQEEMELNLTPMMNLIAILIPCLLVSIAFVEVAVVNVAAPAIGPTDATQMPSDHPPVNLTVTILEKGYSVTGGIPLFEDGGTPDGGAFIPVVEKNVPCRRYLNTVPPPRTRNNVTPCKKGEAGRSFVVYDNETLTNKLVQIKDRFLDERRIIIAADSDVEFEVITDVMDASRDVTTGGEVRTLFDEVVFSPGQG